MCSSTWRAPFGSTRTPTFACGRVNVLSARAGPASASAASAAAAKATLRGRGCIRLEADRRRLAVVARLELEELAFPESERAGDQDGREHLDRVVVRQDRVVVDLARDRDLVLGVPELPLEVEEVLVRLQLRVGLGDREQPAERLAEDAFCR